MMDELSARELIQARFNVPRGTLEKIESFIHFLTQENEKQNLVAKASLKEIWNRHILDSVQLLSFAPGSCSRWIDLGTGAGFPGLILSLLHPANFTLVEERKRRAEFLQQAVNLLELGGRVRVVHKRVERMNQEPFSVISARAFAPLDKLFTLGSRFSTEKSRWILPRGQNARLELADLAGSWQGDFRLEPSLTDIQASILIAERVSEPGGKAKRKNMR